MTAPAAAVVSVVPQVRRDTEWLAGVPSRLVGSEGHAKVHKRLLEAVRSVPGARVWTQDFTVIVPQVREAWLKVHEAPVRTALTRDPRAPAVAEGKRAGVPVCRPGRHRVYSLWPAGVRLNSTPPEGVTGKVIYVGEATFKELPVRSLSGQIAAMEMTGGENWRTLFSLGVKAVVLLGCEGVTFSHASTHILPIPVNFPRFYLPAGELAGALRRSRRRSGKDGEVLSEDIKATLSCRAEWREATATNIYALVPPSCPAITRTTSVVDQAARPPATSSGESSSPKSGRGEDAPPRRALAVAVPFDSMSVVPELAPGADAAVDSGLALELLRRLASRSASRLTSQQAQRGSSRPVLFAFLDAYGVRQRGVREMLLSLCTTPETREALQEDDRPSRDEYRDHEKLAVALEAEGDALGHLHVSRYRPLHRYVKQEVQKEVLRIDEELGPLRLRRYSASESEREGLSRRIDELRGRRDQFFAALAALVGGAPASDGSRALAKVLWKRARTRIRGQLAALEATFRADERREELRRDVVRALGFEEERGEAVRPVAFVLGIDVSDAGVAVGPSLQDNFLSVNETRNAGDFCRWLQGLAKGDPGRVWPRELRRAVNLAPTGGFDMEALVESDQPAEREIVPRSVNLTPLKGLESPSSHAVGTMANLTAATESFGVPGMTWATLDGLRTRVDTPLDTPGRLDWDRLGPQLDATVALIAAWVEAWTDEGDFALTGTMSVPRLLRVRGTVVDQATGEPVARVPMDGYLATLLPGSETWVSPLPVVAGVRQIEFARTGLDGRFVFDGVAGRLPWRQRRWSLQAYRLDDDGSVVRAVNQQSVGKGVRLAFRKDAHKAPQLRAVVFSCQEWSAADLFDPRFLMPLPQGTILDARRGGAPRRANLLVHNGLMSCFLEHGVPWQILLRAGIVGNRMILVNMMPPSGPEGERRDMSIRHAMRGFGSGTTSPEGLPSHPFHVAARDFYRVDTRRLAEYRKAGITSKPIERLQEKTDSSLEAAGAAFERDDGAGFFRHATEALANEVRAYNAVRDTAGDVIRGAIFLLLLLIPFAYAMERLIFASPHIYRQIGGMLGVFAAMAAVLWSFHPAFRISGMPMMIVMAFAIIFVSLMVIFVIFSKFEAELEKIRSGAAESSGARTSRYGILMTAVRLGIANMRKRKLRTALTGVTIMLVTFSLLCFMSTSTYVGRREFGLDTRAVAPAVLVRQPEERRMPEVALAYLQNLVGDDHPVIPRYWWSDPRDTQWRLHARNPATGKQVSLSAALGVSPEEARVTGIDKVCPRWNEFGDVFSAGGGCYLAASVAEELGLEPGDTVVIAGQSLKLIATYEAARFDTEVRRLDGRPLLPPDYSSVDAEERRRTTQDDLQTLALDMEGRVAWSDEEEMEPLSSAQVVILPADLLRGVENYTLRSVAIPVGRKEEVREVASRLSEKLAFPVYFGSQEGVRVLASIPLMPKAPKSLLIPLLIAGLIIFNTMLSSLAERRRDIYIYTSLGLAPLHIGVLFLAEAVTYGLLGAIAGYVVGQGVAKVFMELGWMGGLTLNFGGSQAITTMVLVLGVVIVSSLVPAYLAGRVAAPSNVMKWSVPHPRREDDEHVIRDALPFTATSKTAEGLAVFLYDYFDAHRDGTIGNFTTSTGITGELRLTGFRQYGLRRVMLDATVWLAPYDLGVRQDVTIMLCENPQEGDIYEITIELWHGSGQISSWHRLNRTFLADLRRQLLGWRKLQPERVLAYVDRADVLVAGSGPSPRRSGSGAT